MKKDQKEARKSEFATCVQHRSRPLPEPIAICVSQFAEEKNALKDWKKFMRGPAAAVIEEQVAGHKGQPASEGVDAGEGKGAGSGGSASAGAEAQRSLAAVGLTANCSPEGARLGTAAPVAAGGTAGDVQAEESGQDDGAVDQGASEEGEDGGLAPAELEEGSNQAPGAPAVDEGAEAAAAEAGISQHVGPKSKR